jgi:hypothetical protein
MGKLYSITNKAIALFIFAFVMHSKGMSQDIPVVSPTVETAPAGSLVIAMDNTNQATSSIDVASGTYFFNLNAYGLAILFRNAAIPLRWVINSNKSHDGIDFTGTAERLYPTYVAPQSLDFRAGPLLIYPSDTLGTDYLINWFNYQRPDSAKVKIYRLTADVNVDVRYTLMNPPRVAILHDSCDIHQNFMAMASVPHVNYNCLPNTSYGLISGCYTMVTMPHMEATDPQTYDDDSIYNFVMAGGNMLAACDAIETFENLTRYQSSAGAIVRGTGAQFNNNVYYNNPAMAYGQFQGTIRPRIRGALQVWRYTSSTINNFYPVVSCRRNAGDELHYAATVSKLRSGLGGMAFYLGNHEFYTFECRTCIASDYYNAQEINGIRLYLNAIMIPTEIIPCVVLDVDLGDFNATKRTNETVLLSWNTYSETNNDFFIIEHSTDGKIFSPVGKVMSKGNTQGGFDYSYVHSSPEVGINYYRLRAIDKNGKAEYSVTRKVIFGKNNSILNLFPNPAKGKTILMLDEKDGEQLAIRIYDGSGRMVKHQIVLVNRQQTEINLQGLAPGIYAIVATTENGEQLKSKLMITR